MSVSALTEVSTVRYLPSERDRYLVTSAYPFSPKRNLIGAIQQYEVSQIATVKEGININGLPRSSGIYLQSLFAGTVGGDIRGLRGKRPSTRRACPPTVLGVARDSHLHDHKIARRWGLGTRGKVDGHPLIPAVRSGRARRHCPRLTYRCAIDERIRRSLKKIRWPDSILVDIGATARSHRLTMQDRLPALPLKTRISLC